MLKLLIANKFPPIIFSDRQNARICKNRCKLCHFSKLNSWICHYWTAVACRKPHTIPVQIQTLQKYNSFNISLLWPHCVIMQVLVFTSLGHKMAMSSWSFLLPPISQAECQRSQRIGNTNRSRQKIIIISKKSLLSLAKGPRQEQPNKTVDLDNFPRSHRKKHNPISRGRVDSLDFHPAGYNKKPLSPKYQGGLREDQVGRCKFHTYPQGHWRCCRKRKHLIKIKSKCQTKYKKI